MRPRRRFLGLLFWVLGLGILAPVLADVQPHESRPAGDAWVALVPILLLLGTNALFVMAEFALIAVRPLRINQLAAAGDRQAVQVQRLQQDVSRWLSTTQLGITLSSLALGWLGKGLAEEVVLPRIQGSGATDTYTWLAGSQWYLAAGLTFGLLSYAQLVLGELVPKAVALARGEPLARWLAGPGLVLAQVVHPCIQLLNQSTLALLGLLRIPYPVNAWSDRVTPEELEFILASEGGSTGLEATERELLRNVFEFGDVTAGEVMVPRTQVCFLTMATTLREALTEVAASGHRYYPVVADSLDEVQGLVELQNLLQRFASGEMSLDSVIGPWCRPARFVPEQTPLGDLLALMRRHHQYVLLVVDEFGATVGLVTLQDILGEIVGRPQEPERPETLQILDADTALVHAQMEIEAVNEALNLDLPLGDDYQTLAGFLLSQWQKVPTVGETLTYGNLVLTVTMAQGPRLHQVRIHRQRPADPPESLDPEPV